MLGMMVAGCGAKKEVGEDIGKSVDTLAESQQEEIAADEAASDDVSNEVPEIAEEQAAEQITKENVKNLNPSIVSVERYVKDELGRMVVGYMSTDYVEVDEESGELCPYLVKSLNEFNKDRKQTFEEYYPQFSETANKQYEKAFEDSHSENSDEGPDSCVDYVRIDVMRADNVAMSMLTTSIAYLGGDNESLMFVGVTYDSQTGKKLELTDVVADLDAYKAAVESELKRKYQNVELSDVNLEEYLGWTLTPEGMIVYFPGDYVTMSYGQSVSVQINKDEHPGVINEKYSVAPDEYAIPFDGDDIFYMDVNGDVEREAVVYSPLGTGDYEGEEFPSYEIYVNGKSYQNFEEDPFYDYTPYYVRKNNKSYIYVYTEGYEHDFISVNRFELNDPICVAKLPGTPFYVENIDDASEEFINRHIAFTNPAMVDDALSFDKNICGTYKGDEGDGWEVRYWDISNVDGKYYLDYIGEYDFTAAEIELLDETPYLVGDELRYMVKVYPFSGFAFGGEYQGAGQVMYISRDLECASKRISLSASNPFFYARQDMLSVEGVNMHKIQDQCEPNQSAPELVGSWRSVVSDESKEYNVYLQFEEDGRATIVRKSEGYTPMVYRGIYTIDANGDAFAGKIEAEAIGMGTQPVAEWIFTFDPKADSPIQICGEYEDENPLVYGVDDMRFQKTKSGEYDRFIHPGPWKRSDEVTEMYDEYLAIADAEFVYDFPNEYIENIYNTARSLTNCSSYISYGIQDNKKGGEIWIKVMDDVLPSIQVTKNWLRYDLGEGSFYDIHDNCYDEE